MDYMAEWECEEEERVGHGEGLNGEGRSRVVQKLDLGRQSIEITVMSLVFFPLSLLHVSAVAG